MLHNEWIEYLKRENKSRNCDQIKHYYMPRKLRRFIQFDRKLLETKKYDFIIVHTEEEFNEKCNQNPQIKNVHYLIKDQDQLKWQKSNGPISTLKKYLIMNKECEESIDEEEIFHKNNDQVLIISAEPGMGKSLILDHFTQNSTAENFFIKIILNTCTKTLSDKSFKEQLQNRENDLFEFILRSLLNKKDKQEISLLKHLAKEEKLILMFDGLDEVNDFKEQVIQLIDALMRDRRLKKILITTRGHLRDELEDHFSTFSFNLNNFGSEDQKNFLVKYWRSLNNTNQENETELMQSAEDLIERIKSISSQNLNQLIGIPLQTQMLANIYFEKVKNREDFSNLILTNIAELYNEFIETKIKIQFIRSGIEIERNQDLFEEQKEKFYENHEKLSNLILFKNKNKKEDLAEIDEKRIIKYGIIVAFTKRIPTFLHQSFAEFFLAKSSLQKIKEQNKRDQELERILRDQRHFLVRKFLNDLMENNDEFEKVSQKERKDEKEDFNKEIENCCCEHLISLLKYFIQDKGANLKTKNKFLIIASENGHKEIVAFLLEKGIDINQQDNNGSTALICASFKLKDAQINAVDPLLLHFNNFFMTIKSFNGHKEIVKMLLQEKNIEINQQDRDGSTALIEASAKGHKEIVQLLLQEKNIDINKQDIWDGSTALMLASKYGQKEIVEILLQKNNIEINQQVEYGNTALMLASQKGHKEIVQMLLQDKNIEINQQDQEGYTALMYASANGHKEIVQMLLQDKNIQINQKNKYGDTALMLASKYGQKEIVEILLQKNNIEINQEDKYGDTALMWASAKGHREIVQMLLQDKNIEINQQGEYGRTALMYASMYGHKDIVEMLLQHENIEINKQDEDGETTLSEASRFGNREIVQMLLRNKKY
jgi:ankyrin repeat protein